MARTVRHPVSLLGLLLLAPAAPADVLVLVDGRKFAGEIRESEGGVSVKVEGQELTFAKDEVAKRCKTPADLIGGEAASYETAKALYQQGLTITDGGAQSEKMREALDAAQRARKAYAEARNFFTEDRFSDLDGTLSLLSQLMRLIRERIGASMPVESAPSPVAVQAASAAAAPETAGPEPMPLAQALEVLVDSARRGDALVRRAARERFARIVRNEDPLADFAAAAREFLAATENPASPPVRAVQEYFTSQKIAGLERFSPLQHLKAAQALGAKFKDIPAPRPAWLTGFAAAHFSAVTAAGPRPDLRADLDACAAALGFRKSDIGEVWGPPEGLAARDLRIWNGMGMYDLAVAQFKKEYAGVHEFGVQYALAWLQLLDTLAKKSNYRRARDAWMTLAAGSWTPEQKAHANAIANALQKRLPCIVCGGTHHVRCPICRGAKKTTLICKQCSGYGQIRMLRGTATCRMCKGVGTFRDVDCPKCKATGEIDCGAAGCKAPVEPPVFADLAAALTCPACAGRGTILPRAPVRCETCVGLGLRLIPQSDPKKVLNGAR